ncbi:hypothetical protein [Capnocytophaga sp.]|uniref:hypothetical protein n=1 Tax=Capnocytophaga sp. TaxID=44737 RepID=UPI0026DD6E47|nr:hypothetical protein [Capnocytophaga sp.]MDO5106436.1 hypothetical protein [Capnocytophaga sp.]
MTPIFKAYIEVSSEFRKSNASQKSVEKLYDLCYELEKSPRNYDENFVLCNAYFLLGLYRSAYEIFKTIADTTKPKEVAKLYVWEQKAKSHENNFAIKDLRQFRTKKPKINFNLNDFYLSDKENTYFYNKNEVIIFNKSLKTEKFSVFVYQNYGFKAYFEQISAYLAYLSDCKTELIAFFNEKMNEQVDADWYDALDIFGAKLGVGANGNLFAEIALGDTLFPDHILDIELDNQIFTSISLDG